MMEDSVLISSDSNPSSPPTVLADLVDEIEFPSVKLSELCGRSNSSQPTRFSTIWSPKDVSGQVAEAVVGEKLSSAAQSRAESVISVSDELSSELRDPSNASRIYTNRNFTNTSSYHELSDSDSSGDTTEPTSQKGGISGAKGLRDSLILAHDDDETGKRTDAPLHALSDSDSDRTIPARSSPVDVVEDENTPFDDTLRPIHGPLPCLQLIVPRRDLGSISDDDDYIYRPQSSFKLDVPSIRTSDSCDTLPPSSSLGPFWNLSDDSTQPCPSRINPTDDGAIFHSNSEPLFSTSYSNSEFIPQLGANSQPLELNNGPKPSRKVCRKPQVRAVLRSFYAYSGLFLDSMSLPLYSQLTPKNKPNRHFA